MYVFLVYSIVLNYHESNPTRTHSMTPYIQGEMSKSNTHADLHDGTSYVQDLEQPPQSNLTEKFPSQGKQLVNMAPPVEGKVVSIAISPNILNPGYQPIDHEHAT